MKENARIEKLLNILKSLEGYEYIYINLNNFLNRDYFNLINLLEKKEKELGIYLYSQEEGYELIETNKNEKIDIISGEILIEKNREDFSEIGFKDIRRLVKEGKIITFSKKVTKLEIVECFFDN